MWDEFKFNMKFGRGLCCVYEGEDGGGGGGDDNSGDDAPVAIVDHEGKFSENWRESLPEEIRGEECFKNIVSLNDGMTQLFNAQKVVGKNKVALLDENSTDTERQAFYDAIGRPKTPDDYVYEPDKEIPKEYLNADRVKRARELFREIGLTKSQGEKLLKWDESELKTALGESTKIDEAELKSAEDTLKEKLGMAYEETLHNVNVLINSTTEAGDSRGEFIKEFGRNPKFVEWAGEVAKKMISHEALIAEVTQKTPKEALANIDELQATEGYIGGELERTNPKKHARLVAEIAEQYKLAYPEQG